MAVARSILPEQAVVQKLSSVTEEAMTERFGPAAKKESWRPCAIEVRRRSKGGAERQNVSYRVAGQNRQK